MSQVLYPWGYGKTLVTMDRLKQLARADLMDPETEERLFAYIASKDGEMGIGGAVRDVQPNKPGFAEDGKSFHQMQTWADKKKNFAAVDVVVRNGNNPHTAPRWDEVPKQGSGHADIARYGVHANVKGEPWHIQVIEIDGWQTWVNNGRKRPNPNFIVVNQPKPETPKPETPKPETPDPATIAPGTRTLRVDKPIMFGIDVAYLQQTLTRQGLKLKDDGYYGPATAEAVKTMQGWNGMQKNGVVGPEVWKIVVAYNEPKPETNPIGSRTLRLASPTMRGKDVLFVQNVLKNEGLAVSVDGFYGKQTVARVKILQGWNKLTQDGVVGPKTWEVLKRY